MPEQNQSFHSWVSDAITLDWHQPQALSTTCPICRNPGPHQMVVRIRQKEAFLKDATSWICPHCTSVFAWPFSYPDYANDYGFPDYFRYYCELGAGVSSMLEPVQNALRARNAKSLLDVGCGTPFTVDFVRRELGMDAYGVDPSSYARLGASLLDAPVDFNLLGAGSQFDDVTFDVVYSSEVIEHVPDPVQFAMTLARHVSPAGILVLTTPNAKAISPSNCALDCIGVAWPGIHHAIFSKGALLSLLSSLGFQQIKVVEQGERLIAYAAQTGDLFEVDKIANREFSEKYLSHAIELSRDRSPAIHAGHLFRQLRDQINLGRQADAAETFGRLKLHAIEHRHVDLSNTQEMAGDAMSMPQEQLFSKWPYFITVLPFYLGMMAINGCRDFVSAHKHFSNHVAILNKGRLSNPIWWSEGNNLYFSSLFHAAFSLLLDGKQTAAEAEFSLLIRQFDLPEGVNGIFGRRDPSFKIRSHIQRGVCKLQTARAAEAILDFEEALHLCIPSDSNKAMEKEIRDLMVVAASV